MQTRPVTALVLSGVPFTWRLILEADADPQLHLVDVTGRAWDVQVSDRSGDEPHRRRCTHVRYVSASSPDPVPTVATGLVRLRDGSVASCPDHSLDMAAWHLVGGCGPCALDDVGVAPDERAKFLEIMEPLAGLCRSLEDWDRLLTRTADVLRRWAAGP